MRNEPDPMDDFEKVGYPEPPLSVAIPMNTREVTTTAHPSRDLALHEKIHETILNCKSLHDFRPTFEHIRVVLENLERDQAGRNREDWAKYWSQARGKGEQWAIQRDDDRRSCLKFFYKFMDLCKDGRVAFKQFIGKHFHEIRRIIAVCLVMDRAQALYRLTDVAANRVGKAWYAKIHTELMKQIGAIHYENEHPMNKRFIWLFAWSKDYPEAEFPALAKWIQPVLSPMVDYPETVKNAAREAGVLVIEEAY